MRKLFVWSILIVIVTYLIMIFVEEKANINFWFDENMIIRVKRVSKNYIEYMPFEQYIIGVVSGEMPASFDIEALKAQAVAARSYALTKIEQNKNNEFDVVDTTSNQVYLDNDELKKNWGTKYDEYISKIKEAVLTTRGEYLTYNGDLVNAFFFSTSVGKTESCVEVFGGNIPYLVSVESRWDENVSPVFSEDYNMTLSDFYYKLDLPYSDTLKIDILETTSTGRVKKININEKEFTGSEVTSLLSLRSTFFKIEQDNGNVKINTKGYGHGVGMSQYGAYGMAKAGYKYDAILKYYYSGVEITKM